MGRPTVEHEEPEMLAKLNDLPLGARLGTLIAVLVGLAIALTGAGLYAVASTGARLKAVYEARVVPMAQLTDVFKHVQSARQLLVAASAKMAGGEAVNVGDLQAQIDRHVAASGKRWSEYAGPALATEEKALADKFARDLKRYQDEGLAPALDALQKFQTAEFNIAQQKSDALFPAVHEGIEKLVRLQMDGTKQQYEAAESSFRLTLVLMLVALAAGLALALAFAFLIARGITRPLATMCGALLEAQRAKDLTQRIDVSGNDEIAQMGRAFNGLMESLQGALKRVVSGAHDVSTAATQMASASSQIAQSSRTQSESASSTAAAVEEVTVSINQVADNTRETKSVSDQACQLSEEGEKAARKAAYQMTRTAESVGASMKLIDNLSQRSSEISGIVKVIRDIAEQTNLLALNAAIEAARAGEQGRGFAVVADEVRKLAERTSTSTSEISSMIAAIQSEVRSAVDNLKANNEQVSEGQSLAEQVAGILARINEGARTTMQRVNDISAAASEQGSASNDIARNVERIAQMTEETNAAIVQASSAAQQLESLATSLHTEVALFKT